MKAKRAKSIERAITAEIAAIKESLQKLEGERGSMDTDISALNEECVSKEAAIEKLKDAIKVLATEISVKVLDREECVSRYTTKWRRREALVEEQGKLAARLLELENEPKLAEARAKLSVIASEVVPPTPDAAVTSLAPDGVVVSPIKLRFPAKLPRRSIGKTLAMANSKAKKQILRGRP